MAFSFSLRVYGEIGIEKKYILALMLALVPFSACRKQNDTHTPQNPICEGVIWTLQWTDQSGNSHGMSRSSVPESVPGGNGSFINKSMNTNAINRREVSIMIELLDDW
jgi:hypothetical protein